MKPPICDFCHQRFSPHDEDAGGLVRFRPTAEDEKELERLRQPGYTGHPPNQEWFCAAHITQARALSHLSLGEALRKMREDLA